MGQSIVAVQATPRRRAAHAMGADPTTRNQGKRPPVDAHDGTGRGALGGVLGSVICFNLTRDVNALKGAVGAAPATVGLTVSAALPAADTAADHPLAIPAVTVVAFRRVGRDVEELHDADRWGPARYGGDGALGSS